MADKPDAALKLAQLCEKRIAALEKKLDRHIAEFERYEADQTKQINVAITQLNKNIDTVNKGLAGAIDTHGKHFTDLHNQQEKKFADAINGLRDWVDKAFSKKGFFG